MAEINLLAKYPRAKRNLAARKLGQADIRIVARRFGREYFDGAREQGHGGYRHGGRWLPIGSGTAQRLPFASGSVAAALCINVAHNLPRDACARAGNAGDHYWTILEVDPERTVRGAEPAQRHQQEFGR